MKGKAPMSIITDGDRQMKSAIEQVFPEAHHRICAWHLLRNTTSNIEKPKFTRMFRDCMLGDYEVRTFQRKWFEMVEKFGIADKRWVQDMYERRHSWATTHIRGKFFAGFRTTSRCEALHTVISRYVKSRYSYTEFLRHFHRCLMFVRAKKVEADFECTKGDPVMTTNLKQACAMRVVDYEDNSFYFIHTVSRYGTSGKDWRVVATSDMRAVRCTCMRMECFGVPYEHIIAVLVLNNVHEIPRSLILSRWTNDAKLVAVQSMGVIWDSHFENEDAGDTSFPPEGPPTEGGRAPAQNPPRRNTKGNGAHGEKKPQRCRLCRVVGHNKTTCPDRRTMESSSAVADDMDSMDTDMLYDNLSGDLYATAKIPLFQCSDSDMQAGFVNSDFAETNTSGPVMSLAD
ncbi:protein FAR1-RELATED SEQUENCE 5-like [Arachis ipaensis]|uniref:protein FAR1-RELATED SEQUENCE 5-like n=1 Tax=Arachis ipaensis TaxID=130454 RepID=UPI0007AF2A7A|nr:protein FAR1-RELATED SEQUENCE 5-like [Arachis ipaensis]